MIWGREGEKGREGKGGRTERQLDKEGILRFLYHVVALNLSFVFLPVPLSLLLYLPLALLPPASPYLSIFPTHLKPYPYSSLAIYLRSVSPI